MVPTQPLDALKRTVSRAARPAAAAARTVVNVARPTAGGVATVDADTGATPQDDRDPSSDRDAPLATIAPDTDELAALLETEPDSDDPTRNARRVATAYLDARRRRLRRELDEQR